MKHIVQACKVLIFDLDGTLYEGTEHFDYYAEQIKQELPQDVQSLFARDYEDMKRGSHIVAIGKVYDIKEDSIITLDPMTLHISDVHTWSGQRWTDAQVQRTYPHPIEYDEKRMIAIGDGWWLPYVTGAHYGAIDTYHCYNKTKEYMVSSDFHLPKTPGLKEALMRLKHEKTLVVLTNSDGPDVKRLLKELELEGMFHLVITDAYKPLRTTEHFLNILREFDIEPHEAVSIGDNFINEIAPALKLGLHAVYITPHKGTMEYDNFLVVPTLTNAFI